jgi:ligand-binding sensor domain-containing protein
MAIEKDFEGGTWIGSAYYGLMRMDKGKIKAYPLPGNSQGDVASIKTSATGEIYVASRSGFGIYDKAKDQFKWMNRADGLSSSYISAIEPVKDGVYIGTVMSGLNHYDGKEFKLI